MTRTRELFDADRERRDSLNYNVSESYNTTVRSIGAQIVEPGSVVTFERKDFGGIYVPSGTYGGFTCESGRHIITCAPGTRFQRPIIIKGNVTLSNAFIEMSESSAGITIESGGCLILDGCHIIKTDNKHAAATDTYIQINDGGKCSLNNSVFYGTQSNTGHILYNYDASNKVAAVAGCANLTDIVSPFHHVHYIQVVE